MNIKPYDFGMILKTERAKKKITQKQLADLLNVSVTAISKYECGTAYTPFEAMRTISAIFNVSLDYLYGNEKVGYINTYGLSSDQIQLLQDLAELFNKHNTSFSKKLSDNQASLIGHIVEEFIK